MPQSVLHLSFSQSGGAGNVARILAEARSQMGFHTAHRFGIKGNLWTNPLSSPRHTVAAAVDNFVVKNPDFGAPISLLRDKTTLNLEEDFGLWDVIHLHSANGVLDLNKLVLRWPSQKIVWTLHDMNPLTGGCHYSLECTGYTSGCDSCPAVRPVFRNQIASALTRKISAVSKLKNLNVVAPSQWLADAARSSATLAHFPISVIPNPVSQNFCVPPTDTIQRTKFTFCLVAQNLQDPVKNVAEAVKAFRELRTQHSTITLVLVGKNGKPFATEGVIPLGSLSAPELASTLAQCEALLVPSLAENSPLVIAEAATQGVSSLVNNAGGMPGMIAALGAGMVFSGHAELVAAMTSVVRKLDSETHAARRSLSSRALQLFSPTRVSRQYDKLYDR